MPLMQHGIVSALAASLIVLAGCSVTSEATEPLETALICIQTTNGTQPVIVEKAITPDQRHHGLMGREALPEDHGMLFIYQEPRAPEATFWMYRTYIPLDIAYLDAAGEIRAIHKMLPCGADDASQCPQYPAGVDHLMALEMPHGYFRSHNIRVGHRAVIAEDNQTSCPAPSA